MASPLKEPASRQQVIGRVRLMVTLALCALLIICLTFAWLTRDAMANLPFLKGKGATRSQSGLVDIRPWQTASALAALAVTAEEADFAREAQRLADHEVDQAFASALRKASTQRHALTGEALALSQKVAQLQQTVKDDQARVMRLTPATGAAPPVTTEPTDLANDLDVAKAQLGLDSDELVDARQDMARTSGDERARIQQELAAHEAAMKKYDSQVMVDAKVAVISAQGYGTLARRIKAWFDQRSRYQLLQQAQSEAQKEVTALTAEHEKLAAEPLNAAPADPRDLVSEKTSRIAAINNRAARSQLLSIYDDRIQTEKQLGEVYGKWSAQLLLQHRIILHLLLRSFALIAGILIVVLVLDALVRHLLGRQGLDRRRLQTLEIIFKLGIQMAGTVMILLVVFGTPRQMPTMLGLTTAGITVVLQDFILAFFGWFVLMGKNGIRVGDWVEINGVGGEVLEIGLFRTAMLETGNWTDKGHPTGRRVTFINNFAVNGHYFNFTTTGQWMWDEISVTVPAKTDSYEMIELIHKAVIAETAKDSILAEEEWKRAKSVHGSSQFSAGPVVDMRPGLSGIDIVVRYVTRASEHIALKSRLYQRIIGIVHKHLSAPEPASDDAAEMDTEKSVTV